MANMPRVMFLITDLHRGGSPLLLADLAPGLAGKGWEVEVVSIAPRGEVAEMLEARGVGVTSLEARSSRDLTVVRRFIRHVRERRPDIVLSILVHANLLASLARPGLGSGGTADGGAGPVWVQSIHTLQEKPAWHWTLQRELLRAADAFIAPSGAIGARLQRMGADVPRATVIANGIDVPRFYGAKAIEVVPWPQRAKVVGCVARFDPVKRLDLLIEAIGLLPVSFHLALVGYGAQEERLREMTAQPQLAGRVHFIGKSLTPERWYKSFDIYCNLSSSEGYGLTLAEAACAGLPVVTCDTPAIRETLAEAWWLPAQPTAQEVATRLAQAAEAPWKGDSGARPGIDELGQRYGVGKMVAGYEAFLRGLLKV